MMLRIRFVCVFLFLGASLLYGGEKKLCLTMIVKNEGKIIERCIEAVEGIVDCISICDTGSTDDTVEKIENIIKTRPIPGKVHHHTWKNFGHNRTLSALAAQETLRELGFALDDCYLLFLDADMILKVGEGFDKESLVNDGYHLSQSMGAVTYLNLRLGRASLPWISRGVTHEYWDSPGADLHTTLNTLSIDDRGDGGCKADKFERDVALLTEGLKSEPHNARYMFYLAQSYKCLRRYDEAIQWYQARIDCGGWPEEVWYSKYMIGECYEAKNKWDRAFEWYLSVFSDNPARAEPLYNISKHYREAGENALAYLFAKQGAEISYPPEHSLFVSHAVYDYLFDYEISIAAYYTPFKQEGYEALNRVLLNKNVPQSLKDTTRRNLLFYAQPLEGEVRPLDVDPPPLREGLTECYSPMNPSIVKDSEGYKVICRTVNYRQEGAKHFWFPDPEEKKYRTRNFLVRYDRNFNKLSQEEIVENQPRKKFPWNLVEGVEDCRLIKIGDQDWVTASLFDLSPHRRVQMALCQIGQKNEAGVLPVSKLTPLKGPDPLRHEKNWLPFVHQGELKMLYEMDPFRLLKPNPETGECETVLQYEQKYDLAPLRGSAGLLPFDDGYLLISHEYCWKDARYYLHRFVYLDKDFQVKKLSLPFTFKHLGIEYCCGMTYDHDEKNLVMTFGIEDKEAWYSQVDLDHVRSLLQVL